MEKFLSKEVLRYSLYKTVVRFITIVVKEGQKRLERVLQYKVKVQ